jgi:hypothetical protein
VNQEKSKSSSKHFFIMYGKPAITCFEYQVYLYGLEAITCLSGFFRASVMSHKTTSTPNKASPPPSL